MFNCRKQTRQTQGLANIVAFQALHGPTDRESHRAFETMMSPDELTSQMGSINGGICSKRRFGAISLKLIFGRVTKFSLWTGLMVSEVFVIAS